MRWSFALVLVIIALAACGGDDEPTATEIATTSPPVTDPTPTEPPTTDPPPTDPPATEPPPTAPPSTEPPATEPPATEPVDSGVDSPPAARPDPCSLWTVADLQAVTSLTFEEGVFNDALSVGGQEICDWLVLSGPLANAQVLLITPALNYATLRQGTDESVGPVTDIVVPGADMAAASANGEIVIMEVRGVVVQVAYLPPAADPAAAAQLIDLAAIAAARI
ncbi:MAG: hypothetical protein ACR2O6_10110 [Ilumatobacteraceae bacterium]